MHMKLTRSHFGLGHFGSSAASIALQLKLTFVVVVDPVAKTLVAAAVWIPKTERVHFVLSVHPLILERVYYVADVVRVNLGLEVLPHLVQTPVDEHEVADWASGFEVGVSGQSSRVPPLPLYVVHNNVGKLVRAEAL